MQQQQQQQQAASDLASLNRVSHKLALVDTGAKLQQVLHVLLPRLLQRIGDNHASQKLAAAAAPAAPAASQESLLHDALSKIHLKLVEMLSHVMKRVRDDTKVKLNALGILQLLLLVPGGTKSSSGSSGGSSSDPPSLVTTVAVIARPDVDVFCLNLSLAFLALAVTRCTSAELKELLPGLLVLVAHYEGRVDVDAAAAGGNDNKSAKKQWHQLSHLLLRTLEGIVQDEEASTKRVRAAGRGGISSSSSSTTQTANKRIKTNEEKKSADDTGSATGNTELSGLEEARRILANDPRVAGSCFDLLLDALLYETQVGNVPPAGLSTAGWERLKGGHSTTERDWAAEMAPRNRLLSFKTRLLEWIAPSRRYCLFWASSSPDSTSVNDTNSQGLAGPIKHGMSRAVALLVTAAGDPMPGVLEEAQQYLKLHWETRRDDGKGFGDAALLSREILGLCVGGINLQSVVAASSTSTRYETMLGFPHSDLAFRRRQVADSRAAELLSTATAALDEVDDSDIYTTGKLAILACDKMLSKLGQALGLSLLRGKAYISAADLLKSLVMRLEKVKDKETDNRFDLDARALALAAAVLVSISSSSAQSASATSEANVAVRDSMYGTISVICRSIFATEKFNCLMAGGSNVSGLSTDLLQLLLRCLGNEVDKLRTRATAALDALLYACCRATEKDTAREKLGKSITSEVSTDNPWGAVTTPQESNASEPLSTELSKSIFPLIWTSGRATKPRQSRVVAARWASDLLYLLDVVNGTHLLCFLAGDFDVTASAIAKEGLQLRTESKEKVVVADFGELVAILLPSTSDDVRPSYWGFSDGGKTVAVECLLRSYLDDFHGGEEEDLQSFMDALTKCIAGHTVSAKDEDLLDACSQALSVCLATSEVARAMVISSSLCLGIRDIQSLTMTATSSQTRRYLADSYQSVMDDDTKFDHRWIATVSGALVISFDVLKVQPLKSSNELHGAALLAGTCVQLYRSHPHLVETESSWNLANNVLKRLGDGLINVDDSIGNVFSDAIALAASRHCDPGTTESLRSGLTSVLKDLTTALIKFGNGDRVNAPRAAKVVEPSGLVLCIASTSTDESIGKVRSECVDALFRLLGSDAFRKDEEIALVVGEALAIFSQAKANDTISGTPLEWPELLDESFANKSPPPVQILFTLLRVAKTTTNNHKRRACAAALFAVVASANPTNASIELRECLQRHLHEILDCFLFLLADPKGNQLSRESCCLGLAACDKLVIASESDELNGRLLRAFGATTQYGTSAMQETPGQAAQRRQTEGMDTTGDNEATTTTEANVGGAAGVSEASLGAFREMAAAAVASGRPDILYSMLILSVSHPVWTATEKRRDAYSPSALQSGTVNQNELKTALRPYLARLLPRILRAMNDPNKQTREQMETLWDGLTGGGEEGRSAITTHFRATMDTLVDDTSSKFWRARVGACGALAQIIVGRSWQELGGGGPILDENYDLVLSKTSTDKTPAGIRVLRLWRAAVRALDDVRIPVRESGESLGRSVRSLTLSLCNPKLDTPHGTNVMKEEKERDAMAAAATALRWLLRNGLKQHCAQAAGICVSALIGIIDLAQPTIVEALLSDVIFALLMALSTLEPAAFSYLSVREEQGSTEYEALARLRIQASQSSPLAVAVRKCVDMLPNMKVKHQQSVVPALDSAIRKSSGIATRSAAAECVITLSHTCPDMFRSNASTSALLRCFFDGVFIERGGKAAQDKMVGAFGSLAALTAGPAVRSLASLATERYKQAHGSNDDPAMRMAAAMLLRSIAVKASAHFADGGPNDIWCRRVLPIAFLGTRDPDKAVSSLWKEVWDDGGASVNLDAKNDDGNTLDEKLLAGLVNESVKALGDLAWSRRVTAAVALTDLADCEILAPPPRQLDGRIPKSAQGRARKRAHASSIALNALVELVARSRLWTGKKDVVRAAVKIAQRWMPFAPDSPEEASFFGDANRVRPIVYGNAYASQTDLFVGDRWFENDAMEDEEEKEKEEDQLEASKMVLDEEESTVEQAIEADPVSETKRLSVSGLCRLLLRQGFPLSKRATSAGADDEMLPFRAEVFQSLFLLLKSSPLAGVQDIQMRKTIFTFLGPPLLSTFGDKETKESPLIVARCFDCFSASFWRPMNFEDSLQMEGKQSSSAKENLSTQLSRVLLHNADLTKQPAWTVREASTNCASRMAETASTETLRSRQGISTLIDVAKLALRDQRFWRVRISGLGVLRSIVVRPGSTNQNGSSAIISKIGEKGDLVQEKQLILETVLPHKESIQELAKKSLTDSEAKVTALATEILSVLSTWP